MSLFFYGWLKVCYYALNYIIKRVYMLELITVKEYSKREKISETATRKRLAQSLVQATKLNDITYIIYKNNIEQIIKDLKKNLSIKENK